MNLLQRALVAIRAIPPPQPMTWESLARELGGYHDNTAGVSVNEYSALHHSPVWCGVSTLSRDIAKLPLILYKNLPNGGKERFTAHPLYRILHDEPNPEMTSFKFRETMQALCLLYGNAYAEIVRNGFNRPAGMYPIVPTRVTPIRDERTGRLRYRVSQPSGGEVFIAPENMIHLSSLSTDGVIGQSIVQHASESIGLGLAAEKFGGSFFGNGSTFGGVVEVPAVLDPKQKDDLRTAIEAIHRGVERAHKVLVLGGGAKFVPRGTTPNEGQYIETRKFQVAEVARWLGMPNHKLGDLENAHFTNIEEQELQYYVGCVSGWLEMWEQELSRKLIAPLEYSQQTIEHVLEGVLRGDSTKRAEYYAKMYSIGAFSINHILSLENMNPIGPAGDVHLVPLNMIPAERVNEWIDAQLEAKKAPPQLPAPQDDDDEEDKDEEAARQLTAAIEARDVALAAATQHEEALREAERQVQAKAKAVADAIAERDLAHQGRDVAVLEAEAAQRLIAEREAALEEARRLLGDSKGTAAAFEQRAVELETAVRTAQEAAAARAAELETQLRQQKDAEIERLSGVLTAHRTLIVDVLQRAIRPEVERARRHQKTPESLQRWAEAFYQTHRDVCTDMFWPAILTHLAWKRSAEDAREAARALAVAHCEESERQLRVVIEGSDQEEFHAQLERMLGRWESERPNATADKVLHDEITYLRSIE